MWPRLLLALSAAAAACARAQTTNTKVQHGGATFAWGWQQQPDGSATVGQYYVNLPQAEQLVRYAADDSGYHESALNTSVAAGRNTHSANSALGHRALELHTQASSTAQQYYETIDPNETNRQLQQVTAYNSVNTPPVEILLLQQQYQSPIDNGDYFQVQPSTIPDNLVQYNAAPYAYLTNNRLATPFVNIKQQYPIPSQQSFNYKLNNTEISNPLLREEPPNKEHEVLTSSVVKVFKNLNCTNDRTPNSVTKTTFNNNKKSNQFNEETANSTPQDINGNFGVKYVTTRPLSYRGAVHFRVDPPRENARSEKYYFTTIATPVIQNINDPNEEGINRLVKSTQDLISNEDLLKINHAAEKNAQLNNDDLIKPRAKFNLRGEQTRYGIFNMPRNRFTVSAKFGKIIESDAQQSEHANKEQELQTNHNEYRFVTPIVVAEPNTRNFKEQIVTNLVSTMVPYIEDGYEIIGVTNSGPENYNNNVLKQNVNSDTVDVTPRPLGQKYLAPITVALRLLNANDTETLNRVEDHETSDSEFISKKVQRPQEKTIVEIQESIPVSITHINDVEVSEYLDEGRSNKKESPYDLAKSLYYKYVNSLKSSKNIQNNMNEMLYKYSTAKNPYKENNENTYEENDDSKDNIITSENKQSHELASPDEDVRGEKSEHINYYSNQVDHDQQIIQPIIIEKEVPITKFVDRFIEKQVPYPERVEVIKAVPVDRPVPYPVPYEKLVEKPVEVTRYVDKPYPIEIHHAFPVAVNVPYPVEQKVFVDRPVHVPYPVEKVIEKHVVQTVPVPTPVAVPVEVPVEQKVLYPIPIETSVPYPVEVEKPVPVQTIVEKEVPVPYPVEKRVPYPVHYETKVPVPYPVEKRVPVTVEKIVEKPVTVTKVVEKPVHIQVPVPQPVPVAVHVREPYPVDRIVEKKVPYPVHVDRIVEKKVPVKVPYPVQTFVEKIVEKPVVVTKYVDKPYPVEKRVPYPVEKIVEKKVPYPVHVPVEVKVPYPVDRIVEKPIHVPVKVPYPVEKYIDRPYPVYGYGYSHVSQSQNLPHYTKYVPQSLDLQRQPSNQNYIKKQQEQNSDQLKESSNQNNIHKQQLQTNTHYPGKQTNPIQTTHWGNQYAASYKYVNASQQVNDLKRSLVDYLSHMNYYGPPPPQNYDDWWEKNKNYVVEMKVRRTDRTPKVAKLRIEYGGFKPPLIPSTEVDLDGIPVNKNEPQS